MRKAFRGSAKGYLRGAKMGLRGEVHWWGSIKECFLMGLIPISLGLIPSTEKGRREGGKKEGRKNTEKYERHSLRDVRIHFSSKENKCLVRKERPGTCVPK